MESFSQFHPLFMEAMRNGKIAVCPWLESGTTVDTAVPELCELTCDKEEWRAIIVSLDQESDFPSRPENPYDFEINNKADYEIRENPVPLIRLTQMLGGVPAPAMEFKPITIQEKDKSPRVIYQPEVRKEDEEAYRALTEKYHFDGRQPDEIILVSMRAKKKNRGAAVKDAWVQRNEIDSSEFWKRNGYPSNCRFTVFDQEAQGAVQREADLFNLWSCVLLLACNEIDPSTMQAYKLHRIKVDFDRDEMCRSMQETVSRVVSARYCITKSIQREIAQKLKEETTLPAYKLQAPVVLKLPRADEFYVDEQAFHLTARTETSDFETWKKMCQASEKGLSNVETSALRALDHTASRVRRFCTYEEKEVFPLDAYQKEDMEEELQREYESVFQSRSALSSEELYQKKILEQLEREVHRKLCKRLTHEKALLNLGGAILLAFSGIIPALVFHRLYDWGSLRTIFLTAIGIAAAFSLTEFLSLLRFRMELCDRIRNFNSHVSGTIVRITENTEEYSKYMSSIASYIHGMSFMTLMNRKRMLREEDQFYKQNHIAALESFTKLLHEWCAAYHLPVSFESTELDEELTVDTELPPGENPLYTFSCGETYTVFVNNTGDTITAPFSFFNKIEIIREELYDDTE